MRDIYITAVNSVSQADLANARLGQRFGRMDLSSQLCLLAVEPFAPLLAKFARDRIGLVLATQAGSLPTDVAYWNGRDEPGGLSPTLFTYTLPSAALGEIAIRHQITGPSLCLVGDGKPVLREAAGLMQTGEADAVIGIFARVVSPALTEKISLPEAARACAALINREGPGQIWPGENQCDMETVCDNLRAHRF